MMTKGEKINWLAYRYGVLAAKLVNYPICNVSWHEDAVEYKCVEKEFLQLVRGLHLK